MRKPTKVQSFRSLEGDDIVEFNGAGKIRIGEPFGNFLEDKMHNRCRENNTNELSTTVVPLELSI